MLTGFLCTVIEACLNASQLFTRHITNFMKGILVICTKWSRARSIQQVTKGSHSHTVFNNRVVGSC